MKKSNWKRRLVFVGIAILCFFMLQRIDAAEEKEGDNALEINIRKRVKWADENTGDGKITLQYASNIDEAVSTKDMNIILIQDKSGTMDCNYGYNLEKEVRGWGEPITTRYYPIQNSYGWSESITDMKEEGAGSLEWRLHYKSLSTDTPGYNGGYLDYEDMHYTSTCQVEEHYYLLIRDDDGGTNIGAWSMVHGSNLGGITNTDLHHYQRVTREEALSYLTEGRRVIRQIEGVYYDENGTEVSIADENGVYFLDISEVHQYEEGWILSTCPAAECQASDRLSMSQDFYSGLVDEILSRNIHNKIAYIPFWGDVPDGGNWENLQTDETGTGLKAATNGSLLTYREEVTKIDFTTDAALLKKQIDDNFTYRGTNWSRAFQSAIDFLNSRSDADKEKKTLVIFLTDGNPQGYEGSLADYNNPEINGIKQAQELKEMEGVTIFACGVGVSLMNDNDLPERLYSIDLGAVFARTQSEFDVLETTILTRIDELYATKIESRNVFFTDRLSSEFEFDASKTDNSWRILSDADTETIYGVPTEVYNIVTKETGVNKVFVLSSKTIYWYIGTMTSGTFTDEGHEISFDIKYPDYLESTNGRNRALASNGWQELTYQTTQNLDRLDVLSLSEPYLTFNREDARVVINKFLEGSKFTSDQTYRFAYSKTKYASGTVKDVLGTVDILVTAGETNGSAEVTGLDEGNYYFYEVDASNNIINPQVHEVEITYTPEIITKNDSELENIYSSVVNTDDEALFNKNNYLKITATDVSLNFTNSYVRMDVKKVWDDSTYDQRPEYVTVNLLRNGVTVDSKALSEADNWEYSFENLEKYDVNGSEYNYTVEEVTPEDYETNISYSAIEHGKLATITNKLVVADLTVTKTIKTDGIVWEHGNPLFIAKVSGIGYDGKEYRFYHTFEFTKDYVEENAQDGNVSLSHTFQRIPMSNSYKVEEMCVSRYALSSIEIEGYGTVNTEETEVLAEYYGISAEVDLEKKPKGTEVTLYNTKSKYQLLSHNAYLKNVIK